MSAMMLRELYRPEGWDDFTELFTHRVRVAADELKAHWDRACRAAAENRTVADLHAVRDEYEALLSRQLRLCREHLAAAEQHRRVFGPNPTGADDLAAAARELQALYDELFPRWQTLDDLYEIILAKYSLRAEQLEAFAAKNRPPASWYDETDDPFTAD